MKSTHLRIQAAIVLTLVALVSWPQFRPMHFTSVWRYAGSAAQQAPTQNSDTGVRNTSLDAGQSPLGGRLNALTGLARTSLNSPIPHAKVLLRSIRTGQAMGTAIANDKGQFSFLDLDSSAYVVELLGPDGSVVAASPMVTIGLGDARQADVNAAASAASLNASFGNSLASSMSQLTTVAATNDVTRTSETLASEITPQ